MFGKEVFDECGEFEVLFIFQEPDKDEGEQHALEESGGKEANMKTDKIGRQKEEKQKNTKLEMVPAVPKKEDEKQTNKERKGHMWGL